MRRRTLPVAAVGLGIVVLGLVAACSKRESAPAAEQKSVSEPAPESTATTSPAAPAASAATVPTTPPAMTAAPPPPAPVVDETPEEANAGGSKRSKPAATATAAAPPPKVYTPQATPKPASPHANKPSPTPTTDDGLHSTPAPSLGVKKVAVLANNHYTCSSTEKRDNVSAFAEPRGARISIIGQGPCPGEVHDWSAQVSERRVEVQGTHGAASKCRCSGSGELVLRGLEPGTYDIAVNGGFDRPIATRITVLQ